MKASTIILTMLSLVISQGELPHEQSSGDIQSKMPYEPPSGTNQGAGAPNSEPKSVKGESSELLGKFRLNGSADSQVSGSDSSGYGSASTGKSANTKGSGLVSEHGDDNSKLPKPQKSDLGTDEYKNGNTRKSDKPMDSGSNSAEDGKGNTKIAKPETSDALDSANTGSLNDKGCKTGSSEDCNGGQSSNKEKDPILKLDETALAKIDVPVAVDEKTKQEDLAVTSTIQIIQKKVESGSVTYEERSEGNSVKGYATIYFESIEEIEAIYTSEEIKSSKKEDQDTMKEAKLVACIFKVLSESEQFDFKGQEIIQVGIQVKQTNIAQIEETQNKEKAVKQNKPKGVNESNSDAAVYREHKVAIVKSVDGAAQLEKKPNYVDISKTEDKKAVTHLFRQVEQTEYQYAESIQLFIEENSDGKAKTTQAGLFAQQLESQCSTRQEGENETQSCLVEYVETQLVIYDSSLATTEIKSTKEAVENNDKLSYPKANCSGCSKNNEDTFPKSKEHGVTAKSPIPNKKTQDKKNGKEPKDKNPGASGDSLSGNSGMDDPRKPADPKESDSNSEYKGKKGSSNGDSKSKNLKIESPEIISDPSKPDTNGENVPGKTSDIGNDKKKCENGKDGNCSSTPAGPPGDGKILKEENTALSNITVPVVVDKETKREDLELTSIVQIVQKKFETKMVTYEESKEGTNGKGQVTIYFDTKEQLEAIYTAKELKNVNKEEKDTFKEAAFVSVVGKILVESKRFDFKQQESVFVSIKVKNNSVAQSQDSPVDKQAIDQRESSDSTRALYISRTHQVALVKSESKAAKLEKDVNHIDISKPEDKQAVDCLFQQVDQTRARYVEKIQLFIKENVDSQKGTKEITMLARHMKAMCIDQIKESSRTQVCLMEYIENKVVIYDSKLVNAEIKSTEKAVEDKDKLQYNKDCSECSTGSIATFPISNKYNISENKPVPTKQEIQNKQKAITSDDTKSKGHIGSSSNKKQNYNGKSEDPSPSQVNEDDDFFNSMLKKFGMSGFKKFNMDGFENFFNRKQ